MATPAKYSLIKWYKWLRGTETQESVIVRLDQNTISIYPHEKGEKRKQSKWLAQERGEHTAQKRNRMIVAKPPNPLATVLQKIPRAAVIEAFLVSSAT